MKSNKFTKREDYDAQNGAVSAETADNRSKKAVRGDGKREHAHIDNASFLALLIKSFVSFSLIIILGVIAIFGVVSWAISYEGITIRKKEISDYLNELSSGVVSGDFSAISVEGAFGDEGYLEVVRADGEECGRVIYSSRDSQRRYTSGELDCIQSYENMHDVTVYNFRDKSNKPNYYLIIFFAGESGATQEGNYLLYYNGSEYVVESQSGMATLRQKFTSNEFSYLVFNARNDGKTLTRYAFKGNDGNNYYAITLSENERNSVAAYVVAIIIAGCIIALFAGVMVLYIRYINKHVQKPLAVLSGAMTSFARGSHKHVLYKGSKEFEHLYDSFNEMVDLLDASEEQRLSLERDKQRMLAGLSHDLKTPITIIQGFTKAIKDGLVSDEDKQKYLQIILSKSTQMAELVNQLYEYNKLEHPDFALEREKTDIAELARSFLAKIYDEFEVRGYKLDAQIPEETIECSVDRRQLLRVFENLVGNFFKYTPIGTTLLFAMCKEGNSVRISIADNGPGIDKDARADVFEAFVVAEKSRNKQGSGLGLAVCRRIVEMHGGSIKLAEQPSEGYSLQFDIVLEIDEL